MALNPKYSTMRVDDLLEMYRRKQLNLAPQFQRKSVWKQRDQDFLIDSMLRGFPVPAIFLAKRSSHGNVHDVVDGKQRLGAVSKTDEVRMIHIELTLELLLSIDRGDPSQETSIPCRRGHTRHSCHSVA